MAGDAGANLCRGLAELGLRIGIERFLSAGGALGAVRILIATAQAGMAQGAVATAVSGKLVEDVADLDRLLVDMDLPGILEVLSSELAACQDGRQGAYFERGGGVIGGNIVCWIGPLRIAGRSDGKDGQTQEPATLDQVFHGKTLQLIVDRNQNEAEMKQKRGWEQGGSDGAKKDGTNGLAVRAGRPVTQLTSRSGAVALPPPSLEYIHHSIDRVESKYKNRNYSIGPNKLSFRGFETSKTQHAC